MQIGKLDRRIVYQNYGTTKNDFGELIENYGEANEVWAKVEFDGGSQKDEFDRITAISKVHFYIRNIGLNNFYRKKQGLLTILNFTLLNRLMKLKGVKDF